MIVTGSWSDRPWAIGWFETRMRHCVAQRMPRVMRPVAGAVIVPVQRTLKESSSSEASGAPSAQSKSIAESTLFSTGASSKWPR